MTNLPPLLTPTERTAWLTVPLARYGEDGVARFRAYLSAVSAARADAPLPTAAVSDDDCGEETS